jgi:hypothetical protein
VFVLMIAFVGTAVAYDLGTSPNLNKAPNMTQPIHVPDGRDGGNDAGTAVVIPSLPFSDTGNTFGKGNNWDEICPYGGSTSEDAWYSFTPAGDVAVSVDLCGSGYDTKTYILDSSFTVIACNDDFYFDDVCGVYVSFLEGAVCLGGNTYYIVVDGYGGAAGPYTILVDGELPPEPCVLTCDGELEMEPELVDGYADAWNGGCNSPEFGNPFQTLQGTGGEMLSFCGKSGWYISADLIESRDTDWFIAVIGETGIMEWTVDAEMETYIFILSPQDCATVAVETSLLVGPCLPGTLVIEGNPGDPVWLWVGPSVFTAPIGFVGNEYDYTCNFTGIEDGIIATENASWGAVKSLYR